MISYSTIRKPRHDMSVYTFYMLRKQDIYDLMLEKYVDEQVLGKSLLRTLQ